MAYTINKAKNGIELKFETFPSEQIRNTLKSQGWRWSSFGKFWYNRNTPENEQTAKAMSNGQQPTIKTTATTSKPAKAKSVFTTDTIDDKYKDSVLGYVKLSNGDYVAMEKSKIKTRFCYSFDEVGNPDSIQTSNNCCYEIQRNYDTFEKAQTADIDDMIESVNKAMKELADLDNGGCFISRDLLIFQPETYRSQSQNIGHLRGMYSDSDTLEMALKKPDLEKVLAGLKEQREYKVKQSKTYWKRYGGSKLKTWTFSIWD